MKGLAGGSLGDPVPSEAGEGVRIRLLRPNESHLLGEAIRAAYGETYDAEWVYDRHEVARRISDGLLFSCIAESDRDGLLCHAALTLHSPHDRVGHAGQAVTLPAARGHHLFTAVKRHLAGLAAERGMLGIYSEATAAHPYSQRANVELGAKETGFLLGWIPADVDNDAAAEGTRTNRQSAALFYLRTRSGSPHPAFAPPRHRDVVHRTINACGLHARLAEPPVGARLERRSTVHAHHVERHNMALAIVRDPGLDLGVALSRLRSRLFGAGLDALYVDLPLDHHASAVLADEIEELGLSYAGIFPSPVGGSAVLRLQSLNGVRVDASDVAVVTDHGRELLAYVLADLAAAGHPAGEGAAQ